MTPDTFFRRTRARVEAARRGARRAVRSPVPATVPLTVPGADITQRRARAAMDLALRVGEAALSSSTSAADVVATVIRVLQAYGVERAHVDVTYTSLTASVFRGEEEDPLSLTRVVRGRGWDYTKLQLIHELVRNITEHDMPLDAARERYEEIVTAPRIYRRMVVTLCSGIMGASVALLFGGKPPLLLVAFLTGCLVDRAQLFLASKGIGALFTQATAGVIPALVALGLSAAGADRRWGMDPSLVVVAGIVVALAGLGVVGAAQDAIDGFYITASARSFEVVLLTTGIVMGIIVTLLAARRVGLDMSISPYTSVDMPPVVQVLCATGVGLTFAVSSYTGPRAALLAAGCAAGTWAIYLVAAEQQLGGITAAAVAAVAAGLASQLLARWVRVPSLCLSTASIISLLPGLTVYRGLWQITGYRYDATLGITTLLTAFATGLALAVGVSMGTFAGRAWALRGDLGLRRVIARATAARQVMPRADGDPRDGD